MKARREEAAPKMIPSGVPGQLTHGQNFGAMTHAVAGGDLINAANHAPGTVFPPHEHANAYLCVVVAVAFRIAGSSRAGLRRRIGGRLPAIAARVRSLNAPLRGG